MNYVALAQSALNDQDPALWFNGYVGKQGVVSPAGSIFLPAFSFLTDVSHANCLTALADADVNLAGNKIITGFGEPELPASQNGNTYTVADTVAAWGALVNDAAWVGHPEVLFAAPFVSTGVSSAFYQGFKSGCISSGFRLPDIISSEKYGVYSQTPAQNAATIFTRFDADHAAEPTLPVIGLGMAVFGTGNTPKKSPDDAHILMLMDLLHAGFEARPWMLYYTWFLAGPDTWSPYHAGQNMLLYLGNTNPPQATPTGAHWRAICH